MSIIHYNQILGIANVTSNIAFVPQIFKSYKRKSVEDVSIGMFLLLLLLKYVDIICSSNTCMGALDILSNRDSFVNANIFMWWKYNSKK